ncbi:MAG: type II toxin-antitoxin system ParD family antitoxin [Porticoccaceae bacterium]|nr:type II toxin-antitoxin system ParD family antitoxin [Porticoccaceae bacterium]
MEAQVENSHFGNDSEYICDLIRRDQLAKERLAALRQALADGESSGEPKPLDISAIKAAGCKLMKAAN